MNAESISIALHDTSAGFEATPDRVPLAMLSAFSRDVEKLLKGKESTLDPSALNVSIVKGSVEFKTDPLYDLRLFNDLAAMLRGDILDMVDTGRRQLIEQWQKAAKASKHVSYKISSAFLTRPIVINADSDYRVNEADQWVRVERYMQGEVVDIGGVTRANAHIKLGNGSSLKIEADKAFFRDDTINRLYKSAMVRFNAEFNVETGDYRNAKLISFEEHQNHLDAANFDNEFDAIMGKLTKNGREAWRDVGSGSTWVESLRGNS
jgi:hypothetical protein